MYSKLDLQTKIEIDGVECRKRFDCFTQVLEASISNVLAPRKKRNRIIYCNIDLPLKVEVDCVKCSQKFDYFTQVLYTSISNFVATRN
jgi:hypothetical protein